MNEEEFKAKQRIFVQSIQELNKSYDAFAKVKSETKPAMDIMGVKLAVKREAGNPTFEIETIDMAAYHLQMMEYYLESFTLIKQYEHFFASVIPAHQSLGEQFFRLLRQSPNEPPLAPPHST